MSGFVGTDLAFDEFGDLLVGPTGDVAVAQDRDVLARDLMDRLSCLPGEMPVHPEWGCRIRSLLGASDTPRTRMLARRYLVEALEDDPRIEDGSIVIQQLAASPEEKVYRIQFALAGETQLQQLVWKLGLEGPVLIEQAEIIVP